MLAVIKHVVGDNFIFQKHSTWCMQHTSTTLSQNSQPHLSWAMVPNSPERRPDDYKI